MIGMLIAAADATTQLPDPRSYQSAGWILVGSAALFVIGNQAFKFWRNLIGEPSQPPNQQLQVTDQELARRVTALEQHVRESDARRKGLYDKIEQARKDIGCDIEELRKEMKDDVDGVHSRVNEVLESVAELRGELKGKR